MLPKDNDVTVKFSDGSNDFDGDNSSIANRVISDLKTTGKAFFQGELTSRNRVETRDIYIFKVDNTNLFTVLHVDSSQQAQTLKWMSAHLENQLDKMNSFRTRLINMTNRNEKLDVELEEVI